MESCPIEHFCCGQMLSFFSSLTHPAVQFRAFPVPGLCSKGGWNDSAPAKGLSLWGCSAFPSPWASFCHTLLASTGGSADPAGQSSTELHRQSPETWLHCQVTRADTGVLAVVLQGWGWLRSCRQHKKQQHWAVSLSPWVQIAGMTWWVFLDVLARQDGLSACSYEDRNCESTGKYT